MDDRGSDGNDVIVVGGGLAGLTAATYLARAGRRVTLFEKSRAVGGRAITQTAEQFSFNLGPHALYQAGQGRAIVRELGVEFHGTTPSTAGYALQGATHHRFPDSLPAIVTTTLLSWRDKLALLSAFARLVTTDAAPLHRQTVRQWLERDIRRPAVRELLYALIRVSSYTNDPNRQSAGAALTQLRLALKGNVWYLDGGWQTLVDGLRQVAQAAGVTIVTGARVTAVVHDRMARGVRLADGTTKDAGAIIITGSPATVRALVRQHDGPVTPDWADGATPVMVACLDVGLHSLPRPRVPFALGIDRPLYYSVHSLAARLAPPGGAVIHLAKYLPSEPPSDPACDERELEGLLDQVQPGWRAVLATRRFLPRLTVSHGLVTAAQGGVTGRPGPGVPGIAHLYVAGDWVGPVGMLADASLASAKQAALLALADTSSERLPAFMWADREPATSMV